MIWSRPPPKKKRKYLEFAIQCEIAKVLDQLVEYGKPFIWFHPYNNSEDREEGSNKKKMGVKAGVPDIVIAAHSGRTIWIELKGNSSTSGEQDAFHARLRRLHHIVYVVKAKNSWQGVKMVWDILHAEKLI